MRPILRRTAENAGEREVLLRRYREIRQWTETLAAPLSPEDQTVQSMPDVSPTKWHRAHTSWFFETFLLQRYVRDYSVFDPAYSYLFNSYYEAVGPRHPRPKRGLLSRPVVGEIARYHAHVDDAMARLIVAADSASWPDIAERIELGLQHEQQHQELILMDIKHVLSLNPLDPTYKPLPAQRASIDAPPLGWRAFEGGLRQIGHDGADFAFDNERPRHKVWVEPFRLATRLTTCGEYLAFMADGGYSRANLWLSDGWAAVQQQDWQAPLYWRRDEQGWSIFTLGGRCALDPAEPVSHVSFYEADAFARWCGKRLPSEAEWEVAAVEAAPRTSVLPETRAFHPAPAAAGDGLRQMVGDVWQWTQSPYVGYPGYRAPEGAIGEYNGKFMVNQMVLRGGAALTPSGHARLTYRNFFPAGARWAMSGIRLAEDAS